MRSGSFGVACTLLVKNSRSTTERQYKGTYPLSSISMRGLIIMSDFCWVATYLPPSRSMRGLRIMSDSCWNVTYLPSSRSMRGLRIMSDSCWNVTYLPSSRSMRGLRIMSDSCWIVLRWDGWLRDTWPWPLIFANSWPSSCILDLICASRLKENDYFEKLCIYSRKIPQSQEGFLNVES